MPAAGNSYPKSNLNKSGLYLRMNFRTRSVSTFATAGWVKSMM